MLKHRVEKHNFDSYVRSKRSRWIYSRDWETNPSPSSFEKLFFLFFFFHKEKTWFSLHVAVLSGLYSGCTSDFDRTLCYYRTVRTLYYPFPTQPCIESQKVTRFHVTQLCRRSFLQKFQMLNLSNARNISHHLRLKYSIQRDFTRCVSMRRGKRRNDRYRIYPKSEY